MPVVFANTPAAITPMTTTTIPAANNFFFRLSKTNARITAPIASAINPEELLLPTSATMQQISATAITRRCHIFFAPINRQTSNGISMPK